MLQEHVFFPSAVYIEDRPDFLPFAQVTADTYLKEALDQKPAAGNSLYPLQTNGIGHEPVLKDFSQYIAQTAWTILNQQGFDVKNLGTYIREMWCQQVNQYQGHDEHIHHHGDQISGIYLVQCPETGSRLAIHDPRPGKRQINLAEANTEQITPASSLAIMLPAPGRFYFFNSWLPHSITRNTGTDPTVLIHFNITVGALPQQAEAIVV